MYIMVLGHLFTSGIGWRLGGLFHLQGDGKTGIVRLLINLY